MSRRGVKFRMMKTVWSFLQKARRYLVPGSLLMIAAT